MSSPIKTDDEREPSLERGTRVDSNRLPRDGGARESGWVAAMEFPIFTFTSRHRVAWTWVA